MADDPAADLRGIVISPGPGDPDDAGISVGAVEVAAERGPAAARRLSRDAVDGGRLRGVDRPRADARPRRGVRGDPRRPGPARGHAAGVHGRALPLARGRLGDAAARAARDRDERGRPGRHGHPPRRAAARGRPVPPGVGPDAAGAAPPRELPAPGRRRRGVAAGRRVRLVRDGRAWPRRSGTASDERPGPRRAQHDRRRRHAVDGRGARRDGRGDGRRGDAGPAGGPADGPPDARRDRRRAGRVRRGDARARRPRRGARRARSTSSGRAATAAARSTSRRPPRSSRRPPASRSRSTATAR